MLRLYKPQNKLFDNSWYSMWNCGNFFEPQYDSSVTEDDEKYRITWDVPGFEKDQINVTIKRNIISVKATSDSRKFQKSVELNEVFDTTNVRATYKNGVLSIEVDKASIPLENKIKIE